MQISTTTSTYSVLYFRLTVQLLTVLYSFLSNLRFLHCSNFVDSWTTAKQADADQT